MFYWRKRPPLKRSGNKVELHTCWAGQNYACRIWPSKQAGMYLDTMLKEHGVLGFFFPHKVREFKVWLTLNMEFQDWPALGRKCTKGDSCWLAAFLCWVPKWKYWVELKVWVGHIEKSALCCLVPGSGQAPKSNLFLSWSWRISTFNFPHACQTFLLAVVLLEHFWFCFASET